MSYTPGLYGVRLLPRNVHKLIYAHGWREPLNMARMVAVLQQESEFYPHAIGTPNQDGSQDFGLFQLNSGHWSRYATSLDAFVQLAFDPDEAARIARELWNDDLKAGGNGFRPWAAYTTGAYKQYLSTACIGLGNFAAEALGLEVPLK